MVPDQVFCKRVERMRGHWRVRRQALKWSLVLGDAAAMGPNPLHSLTWIGVRALAAYGGHVAARDDAKAFSEKTDSDGLDPWKTANGTGGAA
jgi:hypothetical protein